LQDRNCSIMFAECYGGEYVENAPYNYPKSQP